MRITGGRCIEALKLDKNFVKTILGNTDTGISDAYMDSITEATRD